MRFTNRHFNLQSLLSVLCEGNKLGTLVQQTVTNGSPCNYHERATRPPPFMLLHKMTKTRTALGEVGLIEQIRRDFTAGSKAVPLGIGDGCAILRPPPGNEVLVTSDFTLEGRHFLRDLHPPESVGHRCLARGLSDLAAMGATPLAAFLSLALPASMLAKSAGRDWVERFFNGLRALVEMHRVPLAGGDTAESPGGKNGFILADIVLVGTAPKSAALRRSGGVVGDSLYVTGELGGAAAELATMMKRRRRILSVATTEDHPQLFPEPRLDVGEALLRRRLATACIDLSDGLSSDLAHLCRASKLRAEID